MYAFHRRGDAYPVLGPFWTLSSLDPNSQFQASVLWKILRGVCYYLLIFGNLETIGLRNIETL